MTTPRAPIVAVVVVTQRRARERLMGWMVAAVLFELIAIGVVGAVQLLTGGP
jgi:nitrate reductase NapE component